MKIASIEEWGEHESEASLFYYDYRIPFEEFMRWEWSKPDLEWDEVSKMYMSLDTNIKFNSFMIGCMFAEHRVDMWHKDKNKHE